MKFFHKAALAAIILCASIGWGGAIKTWINGDTLTITDLNANFTHIHNSMVGGHGARLVNADVSATASIAYSKIQNGTGIARASGSMPATKCTSGSCTIAESFNVSSIDHTGTGVYTVTLSYTAHDTDFVVLASAGSHAATTAGITLCSGVALTTTTASITCFNPTSNTAADSQFSFAIFDSN